jgi:Flp pilus assembly protein TadD
MNFHDGALVKGRAELSGGPTVRSLRLFAMGRESHQAGRLAEAEKAYRMALAADPTNVAALNNLGLVAPQAEKASLFRRALAIEPDHVEALANLAEALAANGDVEDAAAHYRKALRLRPDWVEARFKLGVLFQQRSRLVEAAECFTQCVNLRPGYLPAILNLGCVYALAGVLRESKEADQFAITWFLRAAELAPDLELVNFHLARLLESSGCFAQARPYHDRVARPRPLEIVPAPEHRRTVLVLCTPSQGNTPFRRLLSERVDSQITWQVDYATDAQQAALPPHDLAFNVVGNADWDRECFARVASFARQSSRPLLNPPDRIARTRRDMTPELLAGVPDVVAAPVARLSRDEIKAGGLCDRLEQAGLTWPLIVRPFGQQGGAGASLAETPAALEAMSFEEADFYYFIAFRDYRSRDGYYRKYRTIFVDRRPYPYHLAISPNWLVHYFSASMRGEAWKQEEERRFLESPTEALGARAAAAVAAIGERLDLDYAGVDFTVLPDGRVFVFESNATMSVYFPEEAEFAYKTAHVQAILAAFEDMMERRIQGPRAPKPTATGG